MLIADVAVMNKVKPNLYELINSFEVPFSVKPIRTSLYPFSVGTLMQAVMPNVKNSLHGYVRLTSFNHNGDMYNVLIKLQCIATSETTYEFI